MYCWYLYSFLFWKISIFNYMTWCFSFLLVCPSCVTRSSDNSLCIWTVYALQPNFSNVRFLFWFTKCPCPLKYSSTTSWLNFSVRRNFKNYLKGVILNNATSHNEPQRTTRSHNEPQRATMGHNEPQRATTSHNEPQGATKNHNEPKRAKRSHNDVDV